MLTRDLLGENENGTLSISLGDVCYKQYGGKWISQKLNNGEFDYWLVLEAINWYDSTSGGCSCNVQFCLSVVSPQQAGKHHLRQACQSCGIEDANPNRMQVEALHSYGVTSPIWAKDGNNWAELMKEAHDRPN